MNRFSKWRGHPWLALAVRVYLAGVFLFACVHKIANPSEFAMDIATYDILPLVLINPMAICLPWVELGAGILLLIGYRSKGAALAIAGMMFMFLVAIILALSKDIEMSCGCFASQAMESDPIGTWTVFRDSSWLLMAVYVIILDRHPMGIETWMNARRS